MSKRPLSSIHRVEGRFLRVDTLTQLRWLALFGQFVTVLIVGAVFRFAVPLLWCMIAIGVSATLNIVVELAVPHSRRLEDGPATALLSFDVLQLSCLLFFAGGIENPFAVLLLAPVTIAAVSLRRRQIAIIVALVLLCASVITLVHWPLPWTPGQSVQLPEIYRLGLWLSLVVAALFLATYAAQVAHEARQLSQALTATELALERQIHLSRLDGLAAAAAHELGTPLSTITLVSRELNKAGLPEEYRDDLDLLESQARRCRDILGRIGSLAKADRHFATVALHHLIENIVDPLRDAGVDIAIDAAGEGAGPQVENNPALIHGLGNFIENALDFAQSEIHITLRWSPSRVDILITDDGPGFPHQLLGEIGEPFLRSATQRRLRQDGQGGLGLGIFISKTLLERSGAQLRFSNRLDDEGAPRGAQIAISWPRARIEAPAA